MARVRILTADDVAEMIAAADRAREIAERRRADARNNWRLVMLAQTIVVSVACMFILAKVDPAFTPMGTLAGFVFDGFVTVLNRVRHQ